MFTHVAKERGWSDVTRAHFDALVGPGGAFLVGNPDDVVAKILEADEALGGLSRVSFQMSAAAGHREAMQRSIALLGESVAPHIRTVYGESSEATEIAD